MATMGGGSDRTGPPEAHGRVIHYIHRGQIVVRSWPRKRGRRLHPKTKDQMEWFRDANRLTKYVPALDQILAREASQRTPLLPRDLLIATFAGRNWTVGLINGPTLVPMAARRDVTKDLDLLAEQPGDVLVRGPDYWRKPPSAGQAGDVLTHQGAGNSPDWAAGGGGGGSTGTIDAHGAWTTTVAGNAELHNMNIDNEAAAAKGIRYTILNTTKISAIGVIGEYAFAGDYRLFVLEVDGNDKVAAVNVLSPTYNNRSFDTRWMLAPAETTLEAGKTYLIGVVRTDQGPTHATVVHREFFQRPVFPVEIESVGYIATTAPAVGDDVFTDTFGSPMGPFTAYLTQSIAPG